MNRSFACFVAVVALVSMPESARAYSCFALGCPEWCSPPEYVIGALSSDLEAIASGASEREITRAMNDWTLLSCTSLTSSYGGRSSTLPVTGDGVSTIGFYESGWPHDVNAIGMTTFERIGGCIVESDIALNAQSFAWSTMPGSPGIVNAYSVALHEGGHFYGLGHTNTSGAAMSLAYGRGTLELRADDQSGICYLYPGADPPPDCAIAGCPSGFMCSEGICVDAPNPPCTSDTQCAADQRCNLETGFCMARTDTGEGLGVPCTDDGECDAGLCVQTANGSICSQTCDALEPRSCPDGFHCSGQAVNDCAVGICLPGDMGSGTFGSACALHTECASLHCAGGICSFPCVPGDFVSCPGGFTCLSNVAGACAACGRPRALGEACSGSDECESDVCLEIEGRGVCTQTCDDTAVCPDGFRCDVDGDGGAGVCLAKKGGGCAASPGHTSPLSPVFVLLAFALVLRRRARA